MLAQIIQLLRERPELSTFAVCVLCSIVLLTLPQAAKDGISTVMSAATLGPFKRLAVGLTELARVRQDNADLMKLAADLAAERAVLVEYREESRRLRELQSWLVGFPEEDRLKMLPARVIGMPGSRVIERIEIDRGISDGVDVGMAVVVPSGLVGKVVRTFPGRSLVEPLGSASSAVSVLVERSRVRGIVRPRYVGVAELASWNMEYVPSRSDILAGDRVVTSGLGGVYPPGITVGTVRSVEDGPLTMKVKLDLAVDPSTAEQVFVVLSSRPARPAAAQAGPVPAGTDGRNG
jgi:rod shape-determining protein MreC